jgi:hypothetical protein
MNTRAKSIKSAKPQSPRIAALLNAAATLATAIAAAGSGGPKLPPFQGD